MPHQEWEETDWIQIDNSWNWEFFSLFFDNFFTIYFERCQTSYWCTILGCFFLISAVMVARRSVVKRLNLTRFFKFFSTLLHLSASTALDDDTSVTCTTSKSSTLLVFSSITVYVPYFAQCPGLSYRPSPHISNFGNFFISLNRLSLWSFQALSTTEIRMSFWKL